MRQKLKKINFFKWYNEYMNFDDGGDWDKCMRIPVVNALLTFCLSITLPFQIILYVFFVREYEIIDKEVKS